MILIYGFSNHWGTNISRRTLTDLQKLLPPSSQIIYQPIYFHPRQFFQKYIRNNKYDLIIGLGDSYGPSSKIRIETIAHNNFNHNAIYPFAPYELELSLPVVDLVDPDRFSVSDNMGTYNCNWIAYQIQLNINDRCPDCRQLFFHLPPRSNSSLCASDILDLLRNNQII